MQTAFRNAFLMLDQRIGLFLALPLDSITRLALEKALDSIGQQ